MWLGNFEATVVDTVLSRQPDTVAAKAFFAKVILQAFSGDYEKKPPVVVAGFQRLPVKDNLRLFKAQRKQWEHQGLFIKYLPTYSPELNLIEILWRFIKYLWLPFSAYLNVASLNLALEEILKNIGIKYHITFA